MRQFGPHQPGRGTKIVRHAGVHHGQREAEAARKDVDRGTARKEVGHHLPGDFLRVGRNACCGGAVIAREYKHLRPVEGGRVGLLDERGLQRQGFEHAEAAGRLRLLADFLLDWRGKRFVERWNGKFHLHMPGRIGRRMVAPRLAARPTIARVHPHPVLRTGDTPCLTVP